MDTIKVGYVGAGGNTKARHIPGFAGIAGVENVAVANRSFESGQAVAKAFGIPEVFLDWRDLVKNPDIDAICVGTWPDMHAEVTIAALKAGKHVLCEARMARSLEEAERMYACYESRGGQVLQIVPAPFSFKFDKDFMKIFSELPYGPLRHACLVNTNGSCVEADSPMTWRQDVFKSGKNILTLGIFYETFSRWIQQSPEWVIAQGDIFTKTRLSPFSEKVEDIQIPEVVTVLTSYESGARVDYHFGGVTHGPGKTEVTLNFEKATLVLNFNQGTFQEFTKDCPEGNDIVIAEENQGSWTVEEDFIQSIRNGNPVTLTSPEKGLEYMKFTELVYQSRSHSGMRVYWS